MYIPGGCTSINQVMDVYINSAFKASIRNKYTGWRAALIKVPLQNNCMAGVCFLVVGWHPEREAYSRAVGRVGAERMGEVLEDLLRRGIEKLFLTPAFAPVPNATLPSPPVSDTPLTHVVVSNDDETESDSESTDSIEVPQVQTVEAPEDTPLSGIPELCAGYGLPMRRCAAKQCAVCSIWMQKGMIQFYVCCGTTEPHFSLLP